MSILRRMLVKLSGNRFTQRSLQKTVKSLMYLMGIGAGTGVSSSGERAVLALLSEGLQAPYCLFDVGSNRGQFLRLVMENLRSDDFHIHCFEPGRAAFKSLVEESQKDDRVKLNNLGIGRSRGDMILYYDSPGSGLASLTRRRLDHLNITFSQSETVAVDTIDDYCADNGIDRIHLLKVDVEGHELDAFAGANGMFKRKAIDTVAFEFGGCNIDTRSFFQDFWYFFLGVGMRVYRITPAALLVPIDSYQEIHEQFRTTNFVALLRR